MEEPRAPQDSHPDTPMALALAEARQAAKLGEVPVGAILVDGASGAVLRAAARARGSPRLEGCYLYVTLEPCAMCAAAISFARIRRLYFGAYDPKGGAVEHGPRFFAQPICHHRPEVYGGIGESDAGELLRGFFALRR